MDEWKLVAGLGNPGKRYAGTRHNVGFRVAETLRHRWGCGRERRAFDGRLSDARVGAPGGDAAARVLLLRPMTYMNHSGRSVARAVEYYDVPCRNVLVVLDDLDLPLGRLRLRMRGSSGGHKGLRDILSALSSEDVPRLRIGIGVPPPACDPAEYVLAPFGKSEAKEIGPALQRAADAVEDWIAHGATYVMEQYNRQP